MVRIRFKIGLFVLYVFFCQFGLLKFSRKLAIVVSQIIGVHKNVNKTTFERKRLSGVTLYGLKLENETYKLKRSQGQWALILLFTRILYTVENGK